jgi:hypothetical protein
MATDKETWKNATHGRHGVVKFDKRGNIEHELVGPGKTVLLTPEERALNQDRAWDDSQDVFKNGTMTPVRLLDTTEDAKEIASNPNLKSEDELRDMFKLHWKKFEAEVEQIGNTLTLERLRDIAQEGDATVRQVNVIEARMSDLQGEAFVPDATIQHYGDVGGGVKAVTTAR